MHGSGSEVESGNEIKKTSNCDKILQCVLPFPIIQIYIFEMSGKKYP